MESRSDFPERRSLRLPEYDYSQPGAYFVTLVAHQRQPLFGQILSGETVLSAAGQIIWRIWEALPDRYPAIALDEAVVMPDHFHGILWIEELSPDVGAIHELPLHKRRQKRRAMLLPKVIGYLKMNSAKAINQLSSSPGEPVWQRNYFERVIRNDRELDRAREYIRNNPRQWQIERTDEEDWWEM